MHESKFKRKITDSAKPIKTDLQKNLAKSIKYYRSSEEIESDASPRTFDTQINHIVYDLADYMLVN